MIFINYFIFISIVLNVVINANTLKDHITKLIKLNNLTADETENAFDQILTNANDAAVGALLVLLRAKGETPVELSGMVRSMCKASIPVIIDNTGENIDSSNLLDIVGTGGDGADTINISTAAVILAAACGCYVAKAGNRSVSSQCGSADVLESLGVVIELNPEQVAESIQSCGIGFMYAPINHPAMKSVAPIRKSLGVRTAFNLLGPITNAARAGRAVIGVFEEHLVDLIGGALLEIGSVEHAVVIHGCGLDEISPLGPSTIFEIKNIAESGKPKKYQTKKYKFDPKSIGVPRCTIGDLKGGNKDENAQYLIDVLSAPSNDSNPEMEAKRNAVCLNAGVGLYVCGKVGSFKDGYNMAKEVLHSGKAIEKLFNWIKITQNIKNKNKSKKKGWFQ